MKTTRFNAFCPVEIGDAIIVKTATAGKTEDFMRKAKIITDIACVHYVGAGTVDFRFELDHSGKYVSFDFGAERKAPERNAAPKVDMMAAEVQKITEAVTRYPITVEEVEMLGRFCGETSIHGAGLASFLREALNAKRKGRF